MRSSRNSRPANRSRPAADATCALTRTVKRRGVRLGVWTCSAPTPGEQLEEPARVTFAPVVRRIGRRNWRFWFVSREEAERDDGEGQGCEPGWWFNAVRASPRWISNDPLGPYATLDEAIDDAQLAVEAGGC